MAGQEVSGELLREIELKIDLRAASILVIPKSDEVNDANMPRNLHNAAELFLRLGMVDCAESVKSNVASLLDIYANNPDGKSNFLVGRGCVCWACGFCGLPKNGANHQGSSSITDDLHKIPPGPCSKCGEKEQVNWLRVTQPKDATNNSKKKEELPWIEAPPLSEEEMKKKKEAQLAAKRKEVEEQVKRALEERANQGAE